MVQRVASDVEQLCERLRDLESRVSALEGHPEKPRLAQPASASTAPHESRAAASVSGFPAADIQAGTLPVLGKAVLGIAGAYMLRAIAESGTASKLPLLMVAIVYAGLWMVWAVRTHAASRFAGVTYGITAAIILSPLLWESTVRFKVLSPNVTAVVLAGFVVLTLAVGWQRKLQVVPWVATLATVFTALALIIATHDLVPLTAALLAVALATEFAACMGYTLSLRAVSAIAADFAVWLLLVVMTSSEGVPAEYHPAGPATLTVLCFGLVVIYGGSIGIRSFGLRHRITVFEIAQGALALVLAAIGVVRASHGSTAPALGVFFLLLAAVCYWGALSRFAEEAHARNRRVFATWAAALLLAGCFLVFSVNFQVAFLCLAAVMAVFVYARTGKLTLGMHATFYLAAAAAVSPLLNYARNALAGTVPPAPDWRVWIVVISSVLCYAIGSRGAEDHGRRRLLWIVPAVLVGFAGAALAVVAIVWVAEGRVELNASRLSVIRTVVTCALALVLGFLGSRWKRVEIGWVAYAVVAFGALKLLFEDLRFGNAASLVASFLFYGLILILLPRLTRLGRTES
ncbi:MAG: hypothetical protein WBP79_15525 [Candidatus Acidiferrales bacterium]